MRILWFSLRTSLSLLFQFVLRLSFGLALAMAVTPARWVPAGYYRVHSYVLLGLNALASLIALSDPARFPLWPALAGAVLSYAAAVIWLYEKPRPGMVALVLVAVASITGAWLAQTPVTGSSPAATLLERLDPFSGGLLLGTTMAAMLLGHWYLTAPTISVTPLSELNWNLGIAAVLRLILSAVALGIYAERLGGTSVWIWLSLRWLAGIVGPLVVCLMVWRILKYRNTQAATGVLFVGVVLTFIGETTATLLYREILAPL